MKSAREHWDAVYASKPREAFSWYEQDPNPSRDLVLRALPNGHGHVIDVGGGDSPLAASLIDAGVNEVTVVDVSATALERGRSQFGDREGRLRWMCADVTGPWSATPASAWHDRAVFHFLTNQRDKDNYARRAREMVVPGGGLVVATFAHDGPERCSGLPAVRYTEEQLAAAFEGFAIAESLRWRHQTPAGAGQWFQYLRLVRRTEA